MIKSKQILYIGDQFDNDILKKIIEIKAHNYSQNNSLTNSCVLIKRITPHLLLFSY